MTDEQQELMAQFDCFVKVKNFRDHNSSRMHQEEPTTPNTSRKIPLSGTGRTNALAASLQHFSGNFISEDSLNVDSLSKQVI